MQDDRLRASLANAFVRAFRLVNRVHNRMFKDIGISAEQAHILAMLKLEGAITIGKLQRLLALSSPTLTGAIDRLEADGHVRRVPSPDDRRAVLIESRISARRLAQLEDVIERGDELCFAALTAGERKELLRLIEKTIAHIEPLA